MLARRIYTLSSVSSSQTRIPISPARPLWTEREAFPGTEDVNHLGALTSDAAFTGTYSVSANGLVTATVTPPAAGERPTSCFTPFLARSCSSSRWIPGLSARESSRRGSSSVLPQYLQQAEGGCYGKYESYEAGALVNNKTQPFDWEPLLAGIPGGKTILEYDANRKIFWQGEPADSVFYCDKARWSSRLPPNKARKRSSPLWVR